VTTRDPRCLFVTTPTKGANTAFPNATAPPACSTTRPATDSSGHPWYDAGRSSQVPSTQKLPGSDHQLATLAKAGGCLYRGPTTISFSVTTQSGQKATLMHVISPETPVSNGRDALDAPGNPNTCLTSSTEAGSTVAAPTLEALGTGGAPANGVVYVADNPGCGAKGVNPLTGVPQNTPWKAQVVATGSASQRADMTVDRTVQTFTCAGDLFVRNAASGLARGAVPGFSGNLTVAAAADIDIDGPITYTDCGKAFDSTKAHPCAYNSAKGGINDSLGLVATRYVEVSHPATMTACTGGCGIVGSAQGANGVDAPTCPAAVGDLAAVLCTPPAGSLTVDAAILALNWSFARNNPDMHRGAAVNTGPLTVYGAIAQNYRGIISSFANAGGMPKDFTFDPRLEYVTVPHFLEPTVPYWHLQAAAAVLSSACPQLPKPYPTGSPVSGPGGHGRRTMPTSSDPSGTLCP
jgi:hypothetical protein